MGAVERALADAAAGHRLHARHRLKGYLVDRSDDLAARALLAELYRADGHLDEAGRWGWLSGATPAERATFERQCAHRLDPSWTATSVLRALRWRTPVDTAPPEVQAVLGDLAFRAAREHAAWRRTVHPLETLLDGARRLVRDRLLEGG